MASPGLYQPVEVDDHYYVDGTLNKGMHTTVAMEDGADIVFAINPVVPVDVSQAVDSGTMSRHELSQSGMPNVISQVYRTMVHSRLQSGLKYIKRDYPNKEVILFEPVRNDANLLFSSVFSFNTRKMMCEQAYQLTRASLRARADELESLLAPAGIRLRHDILNDEGRTLSTGLYGAALPTYQSNVRKISVAKTNDSYLEKMTSKVASIF